MAAQSASAADTAGPYRALVCLYMTGGNDSHNWVVPTDAAGYAEYANARRELAWPAASLVPITSAGQGSGRSFGMPQELQALQALYEAGRCAVVANVGPLERPVTKAEFQAGTGLPSHLFSHNDQLSTWQSLSPEGARSGCGGRMGDVLMSANQYPVFTAVSAAGNAVFLTGSQLTQYQVGADGPVNINALNAPWVQGSTTASAALRRLLQQSGSNDFQAEYSRVLQRSIDTSGTLTAALGRTAVAALPTAAITLPNGSQLALNTDPLARQLRVVAQMVAAAPNLGMRRQVFMVSMGGFDSHAYQMRDQPLLMARVANAVSWFHSALDGMGMGNNVTLFTASDFGRTLASNGDGSDHGWGSHHLVVGGAVRGQRYYGTAPPVEMGGNSDVGQGRLLPTTSVDQFAATLAKWFGASPTEIARVVPNIGRFGGTGYPIDLGFLG